MRAAGYGAVGLVLAVGCQRSLSERLHSLDPNERGSAVIDIARSGDRSQLPALVECLEDDDPAVRFYTILALERMTGTRLGYSYSASAAERRAAYHAWRVYLSRQQGGSVSPPALASEAPLDNAAAAHPGP